MTEKILKTMIPCLNFIYLFFKILPTTNKIVMISRQSNEINMDFMLLGEKLKKRHRVVYLCKTLDGGVKANNLTRIKYGLHMFVQMYHLATSKVCILDTYSPTVSILRHKKKLKIVQIWHSIGTMKKFGYAVLDKKEGTNSKIASIMKMHKNYDLIFASSDAYKDHLAKGFNCSKDIIKTVTLPRVDMLKDRVYEKRIKYSIYKKYPSLREKKNIVYCPTFRKDERLFKKAVNQLIEALDFSKYNLIIKTHPLSKVDIKHDNVITDKEYSTFDMLFIADLVISDYSCVIYEAGIKNIPLYFYNFDKRKYNNIRGLAIKYDELPGYKSDNASELVSFLEKEYDYKYLKEFIKKYVTNTKNCTDVAVREIEKLM